MPWVSTNLKEMECQVLLSCSFSHPPIDSVYFITPPSHRNQIAHVNLNNREVISQI